MAVARAPLASGLLLLLLVIHSSRAQTATYQFEAPQLTIGQTTPLLNLAPDIGPASFLASFTVPTGGSFQANNLSFVNPSFSGQVLFDPSPPGGPGDTLRITVNKPIAEVQLDFALMTFSGHVQLQSSAGTMNADAVPATQYGSLVFHSATSFTQFDLLGLTSDNASTLLAIDNLAMTVVPEPTTLSLVLPSISIVLLSHSRRIRRTNRFCLEGA